MREKHNNNNEGLVNDGHLAQVRLTRSLAVQVVPLRAA